jgi:transcriptional regulator with XRE-family HTH domain
MIQRDDGEVRRQVDDRSQGEKPPGNRDKKKKLKRANGRGDDQSVGDRIRRLRSHELELSQVAFADRLGVSRGAVGNWETGQGIKRASLERIVETFNVSFDWLASGLGQPYQGKPLETRIRELLMPSDEADDFIELVNLLLEERVRQLRNRK